jgi:DNA-binding NtrC family response regulator
VSADHPDRPHRVSRARVLALTADLLFGSRVQAALRAAGHDVQLVGDARGLRERLAGDGAGAALLVVDLTDAQLDGVAVVAAMRAQGLLARVRTLGYYSHVDATVRERAESAGFDLVVARSRMAREGAELAGALLAAPR